MVATSRNIDEKYKNYYTALTELIDYLDYGNTGAYFAQPTQGMQNAMGEAFAQYALSSEKLYRDIVTDNADDYRFAQWQLAVIALVVVLILLVAWYGIRRMLLTPLAKIIAHIREIAGGNLANTLTIDGRREMGDLAQSVSHMQRSLTDTVTHVAKVQMPSMPVPVKLRRVTPIFPPVRNSRHPRWKKLPPAWSSSPRQ